MAFFVRRSPYFYPRSPCGERPLADCTKIYAVGDFYPRSPCGERLAYVFAAGNKAGAISIHALLAESDRQRRHCKKLRRSFLSTLSLRRATYGALKHVHEKEISIHALLAESDMVIISFHPRADLFLSTLSLRRATVLTAGPLCPPKNFYPRSPCGERLPRKNHR